MIIATDPKQICLNAGCLADLSFDTDQADFVCGVGHRFHDLVAQPEPKPMDSVERLSRKLEPELWDESKDFSKLESPPRVEVIEAVPVRSAATEKRPEEVKATGIPVRRSMPKPSEFGGEDGSRWVELPNGDCIVSLLIEQHHATTLRSRVEEGNWCDGDPLKYLGQQVKDMLDNGII